MKKFIGNTAIKILAVTLSFFVFFTMIITVVSTVAMVFGDFYTRNFKTLESNIMQDLAEDEIYNLINRYSDSESRTDSYYKDKNVIYDVYYFDSDLSTSNYDGQDYIATYSTTEYITRYTDESGIFYNSDEISYNYEKDYYYHYVTKEPLYESSQKVKFTIYIPRDMQFTDRFFLVDKLINIGFENRYSLIIISIVSLVLSVVIYSYLFISVGHRKNCNDIKVAAINNLPADILSVIVFILYFYGLWIFSELYGLVTTIVFGSIILVALYFIALWYLLSIIVQIKSKKLIKHTIIYWFFKKIAKLSGVIKHIYKNFATVYKVAIVIGVFGIFELIFMGFNAYENDNLIIGWIIISIIVAIILLLAAIAFQKVKKGGEKIVNGDLENKIDTTYMYGDIKDFAESLNNINQGLQLAINDKMKSERFKTELITNVSHDIKTPLTSIVNYVDLIKKEKCDNPKINEYIEVLDRQSIRLKKLIEDLVEASKASTGNLTVDLARCNLSVLINQAVGEFSERLESKNLQLIESIENQELYIMADGRRLWRVFDNLLNNICKYAMNGTRVYIDLKCKDNKVFVTFKNISELPFNITAEELTDRFVRGDRSRNTEGSGLGLSIAKSLTELQNGKFEVSTDGDLFKAKLTFDIIN